jgi:alpha/beta hydrolase fold
VSATVAAETALTAANRSVEVDGETLVYRRFGNVEREAPPLVFLQHFRGNLDNWDPLLVDALAAGREVVLLDNKGVGLSSGRVPCTVAEMARDAIAFLDALELDEVDVLGYSLGGSAISTSSAPSAGRRAETRRTALPWRGPSTTRSSSGESQIRPGCTGSRESHSRRSLRTATTTA